MKVFSKIREFFWPLLEKVELPEPDLLDKSQISVSKSQLERTLKYSIDSYNSESDRIKSVEGKSSLFIGTISVATSIVLGITSVLINSSEFNNGISVLIILLFLLIIYLTRTVWFSIKVLERKSYHSITIDDFLINNTDDDYYQKLITEITNKTRKNSKVINKKVDNMTMAQEYFKRAIIIILIYSFVLLIFFISKSKLNFMENLLVSINSINNIQISNWKIIILYFLVILSITMSSIALMKSKKKEITVANSKLFGKADRRCFVDRKLDPDLHRDDEGSTLQEV